MTDEEMINHLKTIQEQFPDYSTAYKALDMAISKLSTSNSEKWKDHILNRFEGDCR